MFFLSSDTFYLQERSDEIACDESPSAETLIPSLILCLLTPCEVTDFAILPATSNELGQLRR